MRWADAIPLMRQFHRYGDSQSWRVVRASYALYGGLEVTQLNGARGMTATLLSTATDVVSAYLTELNSACTAYDVPIELVMTAMQTSGAYISGVWTPTFTDTLDGYVDETSTPELIYVGLTGILLSEAQKMNASLTVSDLQDVQTNLNACAMSIAYRSSKTKFDPVFVGALYNLGNIRDSDDPTNAWRMLGFRDDPDAPVWFDAWALGFTTAVAAYPQYVGVTAPSFGAIIYYWVAEPPFSFAGFVYWYAAATAAVTAGLTISSTISPQLNTVWGLSQEALSPMSAAAMDAFNEFGPLTYTFNDLSGTPVTMSRTELCRVYDALANFSFAILQWDTSKKSGFPDAFNPFPSTTTTIP